MEQLLFWSSWWLPSVLYINKLCDKGENYLIYFFPFFSPSYYDIPTTVIILSRIYERYLYHSLVYNIQP